MGATTAPAEMPPRGQQRGPGASRPLRLATHNVRGLYQAQEGARRRRLAAFVQLWVSQQLDVILLQETWAQFFAQATLERELHDACRQFPDHGGYKVCWCFTARQRSAGVAMLVRRQLVDTHGVVLGQPQCSPDGRFMQVSLQWAGHSLTVANVYLPNDSVGQQAFLNQHIRPLASLPGPCLVAGDWNFVPDEQLDRVVRGQAASAGGAAAGAPAGAGAGAARVGGAGAAASGAAAAYGAAGAATSGTAAAVGVAGAAAGAAGAAGAAASGGTAGAAGGGPPSRPRAGRQVPPACRLLQALAPTWVEAFRALHPRQRSFTFHSSRAASRLDRWYLSASLQPFITRCSVGSATPSDHRPVILELLPAAPSELGPGVQRVRLQAFWQDAAAKAEFEDFLQQLVDAAPPPARQAPPGGATEAAADQALLAWWPIFKAQLRAKAHQLSRRVREASRQPPPGTHRAQAEAALAQAYTAVEAATTAAAEAAALQALMQARGVWRAAVNHDLASFEWQQRRSCVHQGERPSPAITAALRSFQPASSRHVVALRSATGRLVTGGRPMAQLVGHYWSQVCSAPTPDAAATAQVLQAVRAAGLVLDPQAAAVLGNTEVAAAEVSRALKHSAPGKAPGLDGLPVDVWRKCSNAVVPVLARLYTAMGRQQQLPLGFLDGLVTTLHKKGPREQPSNYRPITLLNSDYRVLAKIMATRLRAVQGTIIQPEQTGFLPDRHIGENILLAQLLPSALPPSSEAVAVFLDFHKAYDTIARQFLFAVMEAMGVGAGFLQWVQLLLQGTAACAVVNGFVSRLFPYTAGVRQGCPLSPQLYLFVAQALLCFLKAQGFGVRVAGKVITAAQYADDTQVYLQSYMDLSRFLRVMQVFKAASGQSLNVSKSELLLIGRAARVFMWEHFFLHQLHTGPGPPPAAARQVACHLAAQQMAHAQFAVPHGTRFSGLAVVEASRLLGVRICASGAVVPGWRAHVDAVKEVFGRIGQLPLSAFGRAFAAAGYGVSKLLYYGEFAGLPTSRSEARCLEELEKATARLVDRKNRAGFAGVRGDLLVGHPRAGGFGALPWRQHLLARHAVWAVRLALGSADKPWIHVAGELLSPSFSTCPAWRRLSILLCPDAEHGPSGLHLPEALGRLATGFKALPAWRDIALAPVPLGSWCAALPLWCNPFLAQQPARVFPGVPALFWSALPRAGLEQIDLGQQFDYRVLAECSQISTVGHAVQALSEVRQCSRATWDMVRQFWFGSHAGMFRDRQLAVDTLEALVGALPTQLRQAVAAVPPGQPGIGTPTEALARLVGRLGWSCPLRQNHTVGLPQLSVRVATALQLQPVLDARREKHEAFLSLACVGLPAPLRAQPPELMVLFRQLWQLPWENQRKELFWRLTLDGLPTAARMRMGEPCACGHLAPDRKHHFWECEVAVAVRGEMHRGLAGLVSPAALRCDHVWLARCPSPQVHPRLWLVVCLSALLAMNGGRKSLFALCRGPRGLPGHLACNIAVRVAKAQFWDMLADFVGLKLCPARWLEEAAALPQPHPFLGILTGGQGQRSLILRRV